ncbi:DMT family transporter [Candidatus Villigracilis saccharophilus]|uniref:DMT family transporter n=1 Tax=Candidatus Villigracilis saccharophilus TaxID=3140684 RepID=UPI00313563A0|nr:DMT family transporter [Anaerolineales bacterium]
MQKKYKAGITAAFSSALFLGFAPVFGKLAITQGFSPFAVVALRTGFAAGILLLVIGIFYRQYLYIFPVGLAGCILAGSINGLGSLLYYLALERLNASVGQLLYSLYPFFVAIWLTLDHQPPSRLTFFRIGLAAIAVFFLTRMPDQSVDLTGVFLMIGASILYAMHLPINQRVLFEVPAPTVALYTLLSMSAVVIPAYLLFDRAWPEINTPWLPVLGLTFVTISSRIALFLGVKKIGGMQTALLGLAELLIAILFSNIWLGENLSPLQWLGAIGLGLSLLLVMFDPPQPPTYSGKTGWLSWIRAPALPKDIFGPYE